MAKTQFKIKSTKTNVRNLKVKKRITHFLLSVLWHFLPDSTKNLTAKRFFAPVAYPLTPLERKYLDNGKSFHILVHGKKIQCWQWGRGPAILFVHGWNGRGVNFVTFFESHGIPKIVYQTQIAELEGCYGYNWHNDNPFGLVKNISSKILLVHDKDDPTTPYMDSKALSEELKNVYLHTTEGLGHKRILRDTSVVDVVLKYIFNQHLNGRRLQQAGV